MAAVSVTAADVRGIFLSEGDWSTKIASEDIDAGEVVVENTSGKWALADNTYTGIAHVALTTVRSGLALTAARDGLVGLGGAFASTDPGTIIYVGGTAGGMVDATIASGEVQTVALTGSPTGGTFTLTYAGDTTAAIAYNAAASAVKTALEALDTIDTVDVTGTAPTWVVTFPIGEGDIAAMTGDGASLTGGTTPAVTVTETTPGENERIIGVVTDITHIGDTNNRALRLSAITYN
jgi:hypothetical protein